MTARFTIALLLVSAVALTGCGKKKQERDEEAAARAASRAMSFAAGKDVKVSVDGEKVTLTDAEGNVTIQGGKGTELPRDFPEDLPVYKQADILHTATRNQNEFSIAFQTSAAMDKVVEFYKKSMESRGWNNETAMDMPQRSILAYRKDNRTVSLMIAADEDGGTVVNITCGLTDE